MGDDDRPRFQVGPRRRLTGQPGWVVHVRCDDFEVSDDVLWYDDHSEPDQAGQGLEEVLANLVSEEQAAEVWDRICQALRPKEAP